MGSSGNKTKIVASNRWGHTSNSNLSVLQYMLPGGDANLHALDNFFSSMIVRFIPQRKIPYGPLTKMLVTTMIDA